MEVNAWTVTFNVASLAPKGKTLRSYEKKTPQKHNFKDKAKVPEESLYVCVASLWCFELPILHTRVF